MPRPFSSPTSRPTTAASATGERLAVVVQGDTIAVGGATIAEPDLAADNGVLHLVDAIVIPEGVTIGPDSLFDLLLDSDNLTVFFGALDAVDLADQLGGEEPLTLFAPTDDAWDRLPDDALQQILTDPDQLTTVLSAHIVEGVVGSDEFASRGSLVTSSGEEVALMTTGGRTWIGGAAVTEAGLLAANGLIHTIDRVIVPGSVAAIAGLVNELLALAPINFEVASADIARDGRRVLNRAAAYLLTNPLEVEVGGHTDSEGEPADNQTLSEERAQAVVDFLVARGVDPALLAPLGYGETQPVATNDTDEGKAQNRRIEFTILGG